MQIVHSIVTTKAVEDGILKVNERKNIFPELNPDQQRFWDC